VSAGLCLLLAGGLVAEPVFFRPDPPGLPAYALPDALKLADGTPVTTADQWRARRRREVLELFRQHVYGRVPATPCTTNWRETHRDERAMGGAATLKQVDVTVTAEGRALTIRLALFLPNAAKAPVPTFLLICNRGVENIDPTRVQRSEFWPAEEVVARGYGIAAFFNGEVDPDKHDGFRDGAHALLDRDPRGPDAWGTLAAWAWGASRCLDYLVSDPGVDARRVAVVGHSRGGKTALWAGAEDERFALVISNDSGCGGAALNRRQPPGRESVTRINASFPHWFCERFKTYGGHEDQLPVDQHELVALVAPRLVYVASASEDLWADPRGEFLSLVHAQPVYRLLGRQGLPRDEMPAIGAQLAGDGMGYHLRSGKHNLTLFDWQRYLDFADREWRRGP
jgi:hypothetical protein